MNYKKIETSNIKSNYLYSKKQSDIIDKKNEEVKKATKEAIENKFRQKIVELVNKYTTRYYIDKYKKEREIRIPIRNYCKKIRSYNYYTGRFIRNTYSFRTIIDDMKENELRNIGYNICCYSENSLIVTKFFSYKRGKDFYKYLEISW